MIASDPMICNESDLLMDQLAFGQVQIDQEKTWPNEYRFDT